MKQDHSIEALCESLDVSRSGYYAWRHRRNHPGKRAQEDARITDDIGGGSQVILRPAIGARIGRDATGDALRRLRQTLDAAEVLLHVVGEALPVGHGVFARCSAAPPPALDHAQEVDKRLLVLQIEYLGQRVGRAAQLGMVDDVADTLAVYPDFARAPEPLEELFARTCRHDLSLSFSRPA